MSSNNIEQNNLVQNEGTLPPLAKTSAGVEARLPEQFEVLETIGQGSMGIVYKAQNRFTGQIVAIKMLAAGTNDPQALIRFQREGKAACRFAHPNAVAIYDFGLCPDNSPYFVMEYVEGENLAAISKATGKLDQQTVIKIAKDICDALVQAHNMGVVHRDLKPGNIILKRASDGGLTAMILDFGIAKFVDDEDLPQDSQERQKLTTTGRLVGTPLYMSPEQCLGQTIDARSDIYSLGAVLYQLLCGVPPHRGETALDTMAQKVDAPAPAFASHGVQVAPALESAVLKCLRPDPKDRYQSAASLLTDLHKLAPLAQPTKAAWIPNRGLVVFVMAAVVIAAYQAMVKEGANLEFKGDQSMLHKAESQAVVQYSQAVFYSKITHFFLSNPDNVHLLGKLTESMARANFGDKAYATNEEWRKMALAIGENDAATDSELFMAQMYRSSNQWEKGAELLTKCIGRLEGIAAKSDKQKQNLGLAYMDIQNIYAHNGDRQAALDWLNKLNLYSDAQHNDHMYDFLLWANLATAQMYKQSNSIDEARTYFEKTWIYLKRQDTTDNTFKNMGKGNFHISGCTRKPGSGSRDPEIFR